MANAIRSAILPALPLPQTSAITDDEGQLPSSLRYIGAHRNPR